jgi:AcrR family transcriptional regulator
MASRLKAAERKASILAVAKVLFADKGFHGVSVDEIARRLGVSPAVLYQHFSSKEDLYDAALNSISEKRENYVNAILQEPSDFASVLNRMAQVFAESVSRDPDYLRMELMSALEGTSAANHFFENRWRSFTDYIEYSIKELSAQNKVGNINPRIASLMFQALLREALYVKCILSENRYKDISLKEMINQLIVMFLAAIEYQEI